MYRFRSVGDRVLQIDADGKTAAQRDGNPFQCGNGRVGKASLNAGDIRLIDTRESGELLLGKAFLCACPQNGGGSGLLYSFFIWMDLFTIALMAFQPQHYDMLLRMMILNTSPLIAHFLTLRSTKITNVAFYVLTGLILIITAYNVWNTSFPF